MSRLFDAFRGFIVLNVFFVIPLVVALTANVPRIVEIDVRTEKPVAVKVGVMNGGSPSLERVKGCPAAEGVQRVSLNLPCDFPVDGFCVLADESAVERVFLRRNFLWGRRYDCKKVDGVWSCTGSTPFLPVLPIKVWLAVALCEIVLFVVSLAFAWLRKSEGEAGRGILLSASVAALASGFVVFVVPLQSFLANRALFKFPTSAFMGEVALVWLVSGCVLCLGLVLARKTFGYFLHSVLLGFVAYEYLQTGILAIGEPSINGEVMYYSTRSLAVRDTIVLFVVMGIFTFGYRWLRPYLKWLALGLAVMIGASLLDIKKDSHEVAAKSPLSDGFCSKLEVAQNVVHSGRRNVMLLILDSVGTEVSLDMLAECPEFKEAFSGFVAYTNNIGVHDFTEPSVPAIMTGKLFDRGVEEDASFSDYGFSALGEESFLYDYHAAGIPVSFIPGSFMFGYSSRKGEAKMRRETEFSGSVFNFRPDTTPPLSLFETVRFRLTPFAAKMRVLLMTFVGTRSHSGVKDESALYPMLAAAPMDGALNNNLEVFHTDGAHSPFNVDREGNQTSVVRKDYSGHLDRAIWAFKNLARLFQVYKEKGIYDKSFIVVTADHGWMAKNPLSDPDALYFRAPTLLWVKPIGCTGPLAFSNEPTWHLNLKKLMLAAMENDLSIEEVFQALQSDDRVFRQLFRHGFKEWHVDAEGNATCTHR